MFDKGLTINFKKNITVIIWVYIPATLHSAPNINEKRNGARIKSNMNGTIAIFSRSQNNFINISMQFPFSRYSTLACCLKTLPIETAIRISGAAINRCDNEKKPVVADPKKDVRRITGI